MTMYYSPLLARASGVTHGFGQRGETLSSLLADMDVRTTLFPVTKQVHGDRVCRLVIPLSSDVHEADAFVTDRRGVVCSIRTADCVPILLVDPIHYAIGAVHSGWRGTELGIAGTTIRAMTEYFHSDPATLIAAIGPAICGRCYDVDLLALNHRLLLSSGLTEKNVDVLKLCTSCHPKEFASYRRDRTEERQVSWIVLS